MKNRNVITQIMESGDPYGIIRLKLSNWNGLCFKFPRTKLYELKDYYEDIENNPCVYFLLGEENMKPVCYVGETDDILTRIVQHKEDYWNDVLIFVGSNKNFVLNKAIIKHLEHKAYVEAKKISDETNRYAIKNKNTPRESPLSIEDKIRADDFFEHIKEICTILGYKIFDSYVIKEKEKDEDNLFYIKNGEIDAKGMLTNEGFVILKDSKVAHTFTDGTSQCFKDSGEKLRNDSVIVNDVFTKDWLFGSPSGASVMVVGHNSNGRKTWKNKDGLSISDLEERSK